MAPGSSCSPTAPATPTPGFTGAKQIVVEHVTPFTAARLKQLYPTHERYVLDVTKAAAEAVVTTFLLPADAKTIVAQAQSAPIPS